MDLDYINYFNEFEREYEVLKNTKKSLSFNKFIGIGV